MESGAESVNPKADDATLPAGVEAVEPDADLDTTLDTTLPAAAVNRGAETGRLSGAAPTPSQTNGQGEETMGIFFKGYLESILQPFAENVNELHKVVTRISVDMADMVNRECQHRQETEDLQQLARDLRSEQDAMNRDLVDLKEFVQSEREAAEGDAKEGNDIKSRLADLDVRTKEQSASMEEAQASLKRAQSRLGKLNEAQLASERAWAQDIRPTIEKLSASVGEIEEKQNSVAKLLDEQGLRKISTTLEVWYESHEQMGSALKDLTAKLDNDSRDLERRLHGISASIENHTRDLQQARNVGDQQGNMLADHKRKFQVFAAMEESLKDRVTSSEARLTGHDVLLKENRENISELQSFMHKTLSGRDHTEWLATLEGLVETNRKNNEATLATAGENSERLQRLQARLDANVDTTTHLGAQMKKVEHVIGVQAKARGDEEALNENQRANLQKAWAFFDTDGDGTMTLSELGAVMANLGYPADHDMLQAMIDEVDEDGSGCVEFDEFCAMMRPLVDAKGEIDPALAAKKAVDSMSLLAKQKQAIATIEEHAVVIKEWTETLGMLTESKDDHGKRIEHLEIYRSENGGEVRKLRQGLELSQEYWKGLSNGLKETRRKVHMDNDFVPNARSLALNCTLPPLASRPEVSTLMSLESTRRPCTSGGLSLESTRSGGLSGLGGSAR